MPLDVLHLDPQSRYQMIPIGLAICLGVLYHLKNPYYVLEKLAAHARYCLLSTRIAQSTPKGRRMSDEPLVHLLAPGETNNDWTNFWIFSETGFRRLLDRTGWKLLAFLTTGATRGSEPARLHRDERAFCLLESCIARAIESHCSMAGTRSKRIASAALAGSSPSRLNVRSC